MFLSNPRMKSIVIALCLLTVFVNYTHSQSITDVYVAVSSNGTFFTTNSTSHFQNATFYQAQNMSFGENVQQYIVFIVPNPTSLSIKLSTAISNFLNQPPVSVECPVSDVASSITICIPVLCVPNAIIPVSFIFALYNNTNDVVGNFLVNMPRSPTQTAYYFTLIALLCILSVILIIMCFCSVATCRTQPMKSRGFCSCWFPYLVLFLGNSAAIVSLCLSVILDVILIPTQELTIVLSEIVDAFYGICVVLSFGQSLNLLRFYGIINLMKFKITFAVQPNQKETSVGEVKKVIKTWAYRCFYFSTSSVTYYCLLLLMIGAYLIIATVVLGLVGGYKLHVPVMRFIIYAILFVDILFFYFVFFFDCILSRNDLVRGRFRKLFVDQDPYYFRTEAIITLGIEIISFFFLIVFIALDITILVVPSSTVTYTQVIDLLFIILVVLRFLVFNAFPLLMSLLTEFKNLVNYLSTKVFHIRRSATIADAEELDIMKLLTEKRTHDSFLSFAESEWAPENILAYDDILKFKESTKKDFQTVKNIFNTYFVARAPNEVNVPGSQLSELRKKVATEILDETIFDEVFSSLKVNLTDTFSRYMLTSEYRNLKRTNSAMKAKLKAFG